ncbi:DUF4252 domain-containing protein [Flavobacterium chuncheonense]|uniref:DUF4252 domain-containing protein n=1 Tax=Flavobacterium chuncheonense TaxID=2026653 RepID=A0ABW5YID3_9FLAO
MKKYIVLIAAILIASCSSKPSLQKYIVERSESPGFVVLDLGSSIINTDKVALSVADKEALESFEKLNVLVFKKDTLNENKFDDESAKVKTILNDEAYQELIKYGGADKSAIVYFVGNENAIDEFVLYAAQRETGFAIVRVIGDNMNPNQVLRLVSLLQKSKFDFEQLKPLQDILK